MTDNNVLFAILLILAFIYLCLKVFTSKSVKSRTKKVFFAILCVVILTITAFVVDIYYAIDRKYGNHISNEKFFVCYDVKKILISSGHCKDIIDCELVSCNITNNTINVLINIDESTTNTQIINNLKAKKQYSKSTYELYFFKEIFDIDTMPLEEAIKKASFRMQIKT